MTLQLTEAQWRELQAAGQGPVRLTDPETNQEYVVLRAEAYARMHSLLYDDSDFDLDEALPLINEVMAEDDANDPLLESYQKYRREPS